MHAGGQTPGSFAFRGRGLLQDLAGQIEGGSCQLHRQKHHTLALQERQLKQIASHPYHLVAQATGWGETSDLTDTCAEDTSIKKYSKGEKEGQELEFGQRIPGDKLP